MNIEVNKTNVKVEGNNPVSYTHLIPAIFDV